MHDTLGRPLFGATQGQSSFAYLELHLPDNERQEALEACKLARQELLRFVAAPPPRQSFRSCFTLLVVVLLRPFLAPFLGGCLEGWLPIPEFMQALLALGGIERASVMLAICRFDADQNGNLTDHEYRVFQEGGKELLRNTVTTCANLGVVASLLIAASHQTTVGRPKPMEASAAFEDEFGRGAGTGMLWATYAANSCTECLALLVVIISVVGRLILTNIMPSLVSKLEFLAASNLNGNLVLLVIYLLLSLVNTMSLSAALLSSSFGFVASGMAPFTACLAACFLMPHYLKACLRVRLEAQQLLRKSPPQDLLKTSNEQFGAIDIDGDGKLSLDELRKASSPIQGGGNAEKITAEQFADADTDGDGVVSAAEYHDAFFTAHGDEEEEEEYEEEEGEDGEEHDDDEVARAIAQAEADAAWSAV